jgi:hypothetical protein
MTKIRKFFYYFAGFVAFLSLMQLPFAFAISSVFSSPDHIDTALKAGGVYDNAVSVALDEATKKQNDSDQQNGDGNKEKDILSDQGIKDAITSSIQPSDVQSASRSAIGGIFAWLQGKTAEPEFTIDLSKPANQAVVNLGAYAQKRAAGLPACTVQQLQTVNFEDDLLSIPCLPPNISAAQVGQQFSTQAKQQVDLLQNPVIDSKKLLKDSDTNQLKDSPAPQVFQSLHNSKWFVLGVTLLLVALLVFARRDRLAGVRYVGILLLVVAGLLGFVLIMSLIGKSNVPVSADKVAEIATKTILNLMSQIMSVVKWFVLGYAILGVAALLFVRKVRPPVAVQTETAPAHDSPVIAS